MNDTVGGSVDEILISDLPEGTKAALQVRAEQHHRSIEAEAREILAVALAREPVTIVDLLASSEGADVDFDPERLGLTAGTPDV
jgi:plasmid stability protein